MPICKGAIHDYGVAAGNSRSWARRHEKASRREPAGALFRGGRTSPPPFCSRPSPQAWSRRGEGRARQATQEGRHCGRFSQLVSLPVFNRRREAQLFTFLQNVIASNCSAKPTAPVQASGDCSVSRAETRRPHRQSPVGLCSARTPTIDRQSPAAAGTPTESRRWTTNTSLSPK
jgi:hypothetical protein